ncbi:MAG TPA: helix-turn-helix domain-containing protein [Trueperaceae bacterium]|nr:helix-turn-helix domain-containing protein [Trueperaceae bacterium]
MAPPDSGRSSAARARFHPAGGAALHTVTDPLQARLLSDPRSQRLFRPFLAQERTVSQVADDTGRDMNAVLYRVRQFLAAGLLSVVREQKRPGRPVKVYRSVHDAYYVPYEVTPFASLEERLLEQHLPLLRERVRYQARWLQESGRSGQALYRDELGEVWFESAGTATSGTVWRDAASTSIDYWTEVWLTATEAREVRDYLYQALEKFGKRPAVDTDQPERGMQRYHLSVATLPLSE